MKKTGICHLCGDYKELTFEHIPPQSAFNNRPIFIKKYEHQFDKTSFVYGKSIRSNKGAGSYCFCKSCNNNTGTWYANDFTEFVIQAHDYFKNTNSINRFNFINFTFKPLNVLKQILTMFLGVEHIGVLREDKELVSFLLNKESDQLPDKYQIYIYNTLSINQRMFGLQFNNLNNQFNTHSEITFYPFGYFLTIDSEPPIDTMTNITKFKHFKFNKIENYTIPLIFLKTDINLLGCYS